MKTLKEKIIDILISSKNLTKDQVDEAIRIQKEKNIGLDKVLVQKGWVTEKELLILLAKELNIPPIDLSRYRIDPPILTLIPDRIVRQYHLIPISQIGKTLTLATADPLNIFALDDIKNITGFEVDIVMSTDSDIENAIKKYYTKDVLKTMSDMVKDIGEDDTIRVVDDADEKLEIDTSLLDESRKAPIVQVVNLTIKEAVKQRASDIHLEPEQDGLRVRYRVDGSLHDAYHFPKKNQNAILVRLKIMSRLDITEWRLPQDGRFKIRMSNKEIDFRVSVLPTTYGQKVVLRLLDKANLAIGLDGLGFFPESTALFKEAISRPYGMLLVTGPTGSGKSTTLYSIVNQLNTPERNIITVEDPVEYEIDGITQIHVRPDIGLTFANGLRALLRQNPDVIMVGEIRDSETADIAVKASLTGQLLFSTLHTNDAAGAIARLIDMGVEPFLVASSLIMACAQRLCRKICPSCKEQYEVPKAMLDKIGLKPEKGNIFYRGKGCSACLDTGYKGRMGLLEVLMVDDQIREMIVKRTPSDEIKNYAIKNCGMVTLWDDAVKKFTLGLTTLEEVLRVTSEE
ncbi:MAG: type II secretion system protein GspE [Candidatus Omnitrophica bacterium]|nr:type II secretion system protein GspE [Candidatus Omnitrophota bacterium]